MTIVAAAGYLSSKASPDTDHFHIAHMLAMNCSIAPLTFCDLPPGFNKVINQLSCLSIYLYHKVQYVGFVALLTIYCRGVQNL